MLVNAFDTRGLGMRLYYAVDVFMNFLWFSFASFLLRTYNIFSFVLLFSILLFRLKNHYAVAAQRAIKSG